MKLKIKYFNNIEPIDYVGGEGKSNWIDLRLAEDTEMEAGEYRLLPLGVAMELPDGFEALVAPRSSTFKNYGIQMANSIGVIDTSYCGNEDQWRFPAYATKHTVIPKNTRIAQFRIQERQPSVEFEVVDYLPGKNRGGIGSTGAK